jgi:hypothetical protein
LADAVGEYEDLPGEAALDGPVGAGRGQIAGAARGGARQPQRGGVRSSDDLAVHAVLAVFLGVVGLGRDDAVSGGERARRR